MRLTMISAIRVTLDLGIPEKEGKRILRLTITSIQVSEGYHRWVQEELRKTRTLVTPFGVEKTILF